VLAAVPSVRRGVVRVAGAARAWKPVALVMSGGFAGYLFLLATAGLLFWSARTATHFLGDGYLWASHLRANVVFNEPVASWLYRGAFRLLNAPSLSLSLSPEAVAGIISVASGLAFLLFAAKTVRLMAKEEDRRFFLLLALLSSGMMLLFFGYVEPYPPFAAAVMAFTFYGIRFGARGTGAVAVVVALAVAMVLHFSAVALLPSVVVLIWMRSGRVMTRKKHYAFLVAGGVVVLAALSILKHTRALSGFFYEHFAPLLPELPRNRIAYPLLSFETPFDSINLLLLVCPAAIFVAAAFARPRGERRPAEERVFLFLATMAIVFVAESLVFNENIGVSRDWDLFAPIAIPLALAASMVLFDRYGHSVASLSVLLFSMLVVHTAPWIALNASREKSIDRFVNLVHDGFWSPYARGYGYSTLGIYFRLQEKMELASRYTAAAADADPGNIRYRYNLGELYQKQGEYAKSAEAYEKVLERKPDHLGARYGLGVAFWATGKLDRVEREMAEVIKGDSTYYAAYEVLADAHARSGRIEECVDVCRRAERHGRDMGPFIERLLVESLRAGDYESARRLGKCLAAIDPAAAERLKAMVPGEIRRELGTAIGLPGK
jgi:tetratricopeptide (TPR) repeat protein